MCDSSVFWWLQQIRYFTENYDQNPENRGAPSNICFSRGNANRNRRNCLLLDDRSTVTIENDHELSGDLGDVYERIWDFKTAQKELEVKYAEICRISTVFNESAEDLFVEVVDVGSGATETADVMLWKKEIRFDYSSEEEEEEFPQEVLKSLEGIPENYHQSRTISPFPVEEPELRQHRERRPRYTHTIHVSSPNRNTAKPFAFPLPLDWIDCSGAYEKAFKISYNGTTRKISKGQVIKVDNGKLYIADDKGRIEETLKENVQIITRRLIGKKEIELRDNANNTYQLHFDKEKDVRQCMENLIPKSSLSNERITIKDKLFRLLRKRSSRDLLEKKGIIKMEPIFGNTLRYLHINYKTSVPEFVTKTIKLIELPKNITSQGVYRASGNLATIQKIRCEIDRNNIKILDQFADEVDVLTGSLKLFFRELSEPLVDFKTYNEFVNLLGEDSTKAASKIENLINNLSRSHKDTFLVVIKHLLKVEEYKEENKMDLHNLSVVWGPSLLWCPDNTANENLLKNSTDAVRVMETILTIYKERCCPKTPTPSNKSLEIVMNNLNISPMSNKKLIRTDSKDTMSQSDDSISSRDYCLRSPMSSGIFGNSLENLSDISKEDVPEFVQRLIPIIEQNMECEGIYRVSGDKNKIDKIKKRLNKNKYNVLDKYKDETVELSCVLKQFFKELKEPLIPQEVIDFYVNSYGLDETIRLQKLQELIDHMPQSHKRTLEFLLKHLRKIEETDENKMCKEAIAIVWAPTICSSAYNNTKNDLEKCAKLIEVLMDIYPPTNLLSTKSKSVYDNVRGEASLLDIDRSSMMLERKTKL